MHGSVQNYTDACYNSDTNNIGGNHMEKVVTFQLKLVDTLNREVLSTAAMNGKNKHEWVEQAIREKLIRDKAV